MTEHIVGVERKPKASLNEPPVVAFASVYSHSSSPSISYNNYELECKK